VRMVTANETYQVGTDVLYRELEGEMILLDPRSAEYFSLNQTGSRVWELLRAGTNVGDTCATVAEQFGVPPQRVMDDLVPFVEELLAAGLVRPDGAGTTG
jgi:Coenzyme PQQ synthesis protein D (PqqD)